MNAMNRDALWRRALVVARELDARWAAPVARDGARWGTRAIAGNARSVGIVELELERRIRDGGRRDAALGHEVRAGVRGARQLPPFFPEEQRRQGRRGRGGGRRPLLCARGRREQRERRAERKTRPPSEF